MPAFLRHSIGEYIEDRYEIRRELGSGAFGTVYLCRDSELGTPVAIKELHVVDEPHSGENERELALAQFRREAVNLSQLRHPHIVSGHYEPQNGTWLICPVCGYAFKGTPRCPEDNAAPIVVRQRHYLVMEYLDGLDLAEAAEDAGGALPIGSALKYVRQTAEALQLIHGRGFVHRDVKPENIRLRAATDDAVLLDFGIATVTGVAGDFSTRAQRHTTGGGTFGYAPPSTQERRYPDARSDIHALGMTLYRLVSGHDPTEEADLLTMRRLAPRELNPAIPAALEDLIERSIAADPDERPQDAREFLDDLLDIINPPKPAVTPPAPAPQPAPAASHGRPPEFTFRSGDRAHDLKGLVRLIDLYRQEAKEYLYHGDFATWLTQIGRADLAQRAREIVHEYPDRRYQGLEALAQSTGLAEPPSLEVFPDQLDFGTLSPDGRRTIALKLHNTGRGHLFGLLRCSHPGVYFDEAFEGNRHSIPVTVDARALGRGDWDGEIVIDSSAGERRVSFSVQVHSSAGFAASITVLFWAVMGMFCGLALRWLPTFSPDKLSGSDWRNAASVTENPPLTMMLFGGAMWGSLLILTIGEALRRKSWGFLLSAGSAALPVAILCGFFAGDLLTAGDMALRPLMIELVRQWAAGGWLVVGGIAGAAYGTLRRLDDVFSRRLLQVLLGWLFFSAIMCLILAASRMVF